MSIPSLKTKATVRLTYKVSVDPISDFGYEEEDIVDMIDYDWVALAEDNIGLPNGELVDWEVS